MTVLNNILIYSFLAVLATLLGVFLSRRFSAWMQKRSGLMISFAAGVILANAFFHLLPEAIDLGSEWPYWVLGTILVFFLIEHLIIVHSCREKECQVHHSLGLMSLIGIGLHSFIDGLIIAVSFTAGGFLIGFTTSMAIIFHKVAEGGCTYGLLICDDFSQKKALVYSWLVALAAPLGAVFIYFFAREASSFFLGRLLAVAAGSFIYIGASDLLPETHKKSSFYNAFLVLAGICLVLALGLLE